MKQVNALEFRKKFGMVLDEVHDKGMSIMVTRSHQPLAVLVPYEQYQGERRLRLELAQRQKYAKKLEEFREKIGPKLKNIDFTEEIRKWRDK